MALVRSNDTYTLCEFAYETTYGTIQTYAAGFTLTGVRRFPFVAEDLKLERETLPLSEEFTPFAGLSGVDLGKTRVRGSITVEPDYESQWFWMLFGLAFSYENVITQRTLSDETTAVTDPADGLNVHLFNNGNILKSATLWLWKSGPTAGASTYVDVISGAYVTSWSWEQPEGNRARLVLNILAKDWLTVPANTLNAGAPLGSYVTAPKVAVQHLGTGSNAGLILFGAGAGDVVNLNLTGFTINCDRKIDDTSGAFLNEVLTANQPGIEGIREVTVDITTNLEQDYGATGKPWPLWVAGTQGAMHVKYDSGVAASVTPASNFGIRFDIPGLVFTDASNSVSRAGVVQLTASATCPLAALTRLGPTYDLWPTVPAGGLVDIRVGTVLTTPATAIDGRGEWSNDAAVTGLGAA